MKICSTLVISLSLLLSSIATANTSATAIAPNLPTYSKIYDDQRDPFKDATAALALAKETNRQVLIEIGGNWCSWCHKMDSFLAKNPDVYKALHSQYVLLKISVSDSNENNDFMKSLPPVLGYPHMYVSTAQGKMILSKDTAELLAGNDYSKSQWLSFLTDWSVNTTKAKAKLAASVD
ncbi:thioredoxin family protein [Colwellia sp. 12G3]|uniref:thioredoxin family protein n=1 Tax=Colwellia sp. 12G3 TaxID=2058299 RepID=UPI000C33A6AC|nr:thioredoxin family protein [Colwellia sp. 12G3]PKI16367.1 thioredoxin family protein [Colwellia sp. 12G3]